MALTNAAPPPEADELVVAKLTMLARHPSGRAILEGADPERLSVAAPHPIYACQVSDVAAGRLLDAAVRTGWRYILFDGNRPYGAAEVSEDAETGAFGFSNVTTGGEVEQSVAALAMLDDADTFEGDLEVRLLRVPALVVSAIWLAGEADVLIPLVTIHGLQQLGRYRESQALEFLRLPAQTVLEFAQTDPLAEV